jgi:hypothetical protein
MRKNVGIIQGRCQAWKPGESAKEDTNRNPTPDDTLGKRWTNEEKKDVRTRIWTGVSAFADINNRRHLHPWRAGMRSKTRLKSLPVQTSTGAIHECRQKKIQN